MTCSIYYVASVPKLNEWHVLYPMPGFMEW